MSEINYQALREAAERAIPAMERLLMLPADDDLLSEQELKDYGVDIDALNAFKFLTGPETVLALLDERERNQQYIKRRDQENEEIALTVGKLRVELEEVKQHAEELSETKAVRNQWRPDICPITGRAFFMWIEHPTLGNVPTYGGPLDSYTIPTKDGDGEFSCERYDHDFGGDRRGIGDCLDEAEQELIVTINKYASQLAAEPIATNDVREQTAVPPVPVIQADVAQAIEKLKRKLVECNRYNYCADAVKGVEYACRVLALQNQNMSAPIRSEAIENAIEYIRSIAFHIDEDDYHGKHIAYFMRQALAWLEGHSCSAESQGKSDNSPLPRYQVIELTVLVKQLVSQLKKAKPDCKLPDRAMDYLLRNGLVSAEGVLR